MFKKLLLALVIIIIGLVVVISLRPSHFSVSRSVTIAAAPDVVFPQVNELKKWEEWNPFIYKWEGMTPQGKLDPDAKMTYDGPPAGVGASYSWSGNNQVGEGKNTITESKPGELVKFKLDFIRPMKATNDVEFTFKPEGGNTVVTWTMTGENGFVGKAFGLVVNCDKMCGDLFEKGLARMKAIVEGKK